MSSGHFSKRNLSFKPQDSDQTEMVEETTATTANPRLFAEAKDLEVKENTFRRPLPKTLGAIVLSQSKFRLHHNSVLSE